jgi:UDP-GlcNAc:undecaprenyl-phosphate/decaprenyl-phosphate GlcNAc-1-phosphate transferase
MIYFLIAIVAFFVTFLVTPSIRFVALRFDVVDRKNYRTVHNKVITKLGGIAIYAGIVVAIMVAILLEFEHVSADLFSLGAIFICSTLIFLLGIYDDIRGANAIIKFAVQIVAALILIKAGFVIEEISLISHVIPLGNFDIWFTLLFIIALTNAMNLIDGLDGLSPGIACIAVTGLFLLFILKVNNVMGAVLCVALLGSCFGFLQYNFYPAKVFMGDTGSLVLGFFLAALIILCVGSGSDPVSIVIPCIALAVPLLDTGVAFIRRLMRLRHPFQADKAHVHHWLMKCGFSHMQTVIVLYVVTFGLTILSITLALLV